MSKGPVQKEREGLHKIGRRYIGNEPRDKFWADVSLATLFRSTKYRDRTGNTLAKHSEYRSRENRQILGQ
jgi:hypothetical protein